MKVTSMVTRYSTILPFDFSLQGEHLETGDASSDSGISTALRMRPTQ